MSTTKTRSTTARKDPLVAASDREDVPRPRLVTTPRRGKASPEFPGALDATTVMEHIRVRAYYLSLERNGFATDPVGDWLRAERELITGGHGATARG